MTIAQYSQPTQVLSLQGAVQTTILNATFSGFTLSSGNSSLDDFPIPDDLKGHTPYLVVETPEWAHNAEGINRTAGILHRYWDIAVWVIWPTDYTNTNSALAKSCWEQLTILFDEQIDLGNVCEEVICWGQKTRTLKDESQGTAAYKCAYVIVRVKEALQIVDILRGTP